MQESKNGKREAPREGGKRVKGVDSFHGKSALFYENGDFSPIMHVLCLSPPFYISLRLLRPFETCAGFGGGERNDGMGDGGTALATIVAEAVMEALATLVFGPRFVAATTGCFGTACNVAAFFLVCNAAAFFLAARATLA